MAPIDDPYRQATAAHIRTLGVPAGAVLARSGFAAFLPGCRAADGRATPDVPAVLALHKGRLDDVHSELLRTAFDGYRVSFANEVFMVLSQAGAPVAPDNPHVLGREALLAAAIEVLECKLAAAPPAPPQERKRMPAVYVG